jgi:hypothetical protein
LIVRIEKTAIPSPEMKLSSPGNPFVQAVLARPDEQQTQEQHGVFGGVAGRAPARSIVVHRGHEHGDGKQRASGTKEEPQSNQQSPNRFGEGRHEPEEAVAEPDTEVPHRPSDLCPPLGPTDQLAPPVIKQESKTESQSHDQQTHIPVLLERVPDHLGSSLVSRQVKQRAASHRLPATPGVIIWSATKRPSMFAILSG